jgi:hypothetical protein
MDAKPTYRERIKAVIRRKLGIDLKQINTDIEALQGLTENEKEKEDRRELFKKLLKSYSLPDKLRHLKKYWWIYSTISGILGWLYKNASHFFIHKP